MKRIVVAILGGSVLLVGVAMVVLPGPAFLVIPAGLAILATEFVWARRALRKAKQLATRARGSAITLLSGPATLATKTRRAPSTPTIPSSPECCP